MIPGIFSSNSGVNLDRMDTMSANIAKLELGGMCPISVIADANGFGRLIQQDNGMSPLVNWHDESAYAPVVTFTANATNAATSVTIAAGAGVQPYSVITNSKTGEYLYVTAVSGTTLTVIRGLGGTTAGAITAGDKGSYIGTAMPEGGEAPQAFYKKGAIHYNVTQIFRDRYSVSGTAGATKFRTGDKVSKSIEDARSMHATVKEAAMLLGRKTQMQVDVNNEARTMDGLLTMLTNNQAIAGAGTLTLDALIDWGTDVFSVNVKGAVNERVCFTDYKTLNLINKLVRKDGNSSYGITDRQKVYGIDVQTIVLPGSLPDMKFIVHPLWNVLPELAGTITAFHPGCIKPHYLREAKIEPITGSGADVASDGVITTEMSLVYSNASTGGTLSNIKLA